MKSVECNIEVLRNCTVQPTFQFKSIVQLTLRSSNMRTW